MIALLFCICGVFAVAMFLMLRLLIDMWMTLDYLWTHVDPLGGESE